MKKMVWCVAVCLVVAQAWSQVEVRNIEKLDIETSHGWSCPHFSAQGTSIYLTTEDFGGIWEYSLLTRTLRQLTTDQGAGYGFSISEDGAKIAYRRTRTISSNRRRSQEIVTLDMGNGRSSVVAEGPSLPLPVYSGTTLTSVSGKELTGAPRTTAVGVVVLGIENTKIAILRNGIKELLDPLGHGSYIWPSLSPQGTSIVAYEVDHGTFVCDARGNVVARLGRRDAPAWTRDGRWIVYMQDRDDGYRILASDLFCVSPDGNRTIRLTDTPDIVELNPQCSPTENRIVFNTLDGSVYLLTYAEEE